MFYLKIGFKNLLKNRRRTLLTLLTIVIGMSALILANGFVNYTLWGLRESIINGGIGHFQIYKKGFIQYGDEDPYNYFITNYKKVLRDIYSIPGVKVVAPRLKFQGIITTSDKNTILMGSAGLTEDETALSTFNTAESGGNLKDEDPYSMVIGSGVARKLNVTTGDSCTIMISMKDGGINALDFNITGVTRSQMADLDNVYGLAQLGTIQKLLNISNSIDTLAVKLTQTENLASAEPKIRAVCDKYGLEYRRWDEIAPYYYGAKDFYDSAMQIAVIIIFAIVIFAVANTMTMTLFERVREIGTIRSLGTTRSQVLRIFLSESFLLGLFGSLLGIIVGLIIAQTVNTLGGIPIPPPPGNSKGYQAMISPAPLSNLIYAAMFIVVSVAAAFYPAWKSSRMAIADALRWI